MRSHSHIGTHTLGGRSTETPSPLPTLLFCIKSSALCFASSSPRFRRRYITSAQGPQDYNSLLRIEQKGSCRYKNISAMSRNDYYNQGQYPPQQGGYPQGYPQQPPHVSGRHAQPVRISLTKILCRHTVKDLPLSSTIHSNKRRCNINNKPPLLGARVEEVVSMLAWQHSVVVALSKKGASVAPTVVIAAWTCVKL